MEVTNNSLVHKSQSEVLQGLYDRFKSLEFLLRGKRTVPEGALKQIQENISTIDKLLLSPKPGSSLVCTILNSLKDQANEQLSLLRYAMKIKCVRSTPQNSTTSKQNPQKVTGSKEDNVTEIKDCELDVTGQGFSNIAGLEKAKSALMSIVILPINQPQLYDGFRLRNCVLLYGPPGTGKTKLAIATAAEANAVFLSVTSSCILSPYVGRSEKFIQNIFNYVKSSNRPTVLFIDEIDGLCRKRTDGESDHTRRLKTEIMCQMTEFTKYANGFLICATNCPWELDTAFKRRFQRQLYIPLPNQTERFQLLKLYTQGTSLKDTQLFWNDIILRTERYSGSDMERLVMQGLIKPIERLQRTRAWTKLPNGLYKPFSGTDSYRDVTVEDIHSLPPKSIQKVDAELNDLIEALDEVLPTVTAEEIAKFESYSA